MVCAVGRKLPPDGAFLPGQREMVLSPAPAGRAGQEENYDATSVRRRRADTAGWRGAAGEPSLRAALADRRGAGLVGAGGRAEGGGEDRAPAGAAPWAADHPRAGRG